MYIVKYITSFLAIFLQRLTHSFALSVSFLAVAGCSTTACVLMAPGPSVEESAARSRVQSVLMEKLCCL